MSAAHASEKMTTYRRYPRMPPRGGAGAEADGATHGSSAAMTSFNAPRDVGTEEDGIEFPPPLLDALIECGVPPPRDRTMPRGAAGEGCAERVGGGTGWVGRGWEGG